MGKLDNINEAIDNNNALLTGKQLVMIVIGNAMLAMAMNFVITPFNLYCSGAMGVAQLITALLVDVLHVPPIPGVEWLGIVFWGMSIPILLIGAKDLGKKFFIKTIFSITVLSLFIAFLPVFAQSVIHSRVMGCLAAGMFGGIGVGFVLTAGAATGGGDVVGMILTDKIPGFSVGMMNMILNVCIYTICAIAYGLENAVYSICFAYVLSWAMDKYHKQNHYIEITVYSKVPDMAHTLAVDLQRGVTTWPGEGGYTGERTDVIKLITTKQEVDKSVRNIREKDPAAFISVHEIGKVHGIFDKHLSS